MRRPAEGVDARSETSATSSSTPSRCTDAGEATSTAPRSPACTKRSPTKSGPVQANRVLAGTVGLLRLVGRQRATELNPVLAVPKNARDRARARAVRRRDPRNLGRHGIGLRLRSHRPAFAAHRTPALGSRLYAVAGKIAMATLWTVPGERMKNGLPHEVPFARKRTGCLPPMGEGATVQTAQKFVFGKAAQG